MASCSGMVASSDGSGLPDALPLPPRRKHRPAADVVVDAFLGLRRGRSLRDAPEAGLLHVVAAEHALAHVVAPGPAGHVGAHLRRDRRCRVLAVHGREVLSLRRGEHAFEQARRPRLSELAAHEVRLLVVQVRGVENFVERTPPQRRLGLAVHRACDPPIVVVGPVLVLVLVALRHAEVVEEVALVEEDRAVGLHVFERRVQAVNHGAHLDGPKADPGAVGEEAKWPSNLEVQHRPSPNRSDDFDRGQQREEAPLELVVRAAHGVDALRQVLEVNGPVEVQRHRQASRSAWRA